MTFEEVWAKVDGLPNTAMRQVPGVISSTTKKRLSRKSPEQIKKILEAAIDEVNHGSVTPLDELIRKRL